MILKQGPCILLIEIECDKFSQKTITFEQGLNIVLGDPKAKNSIGKSSLLMIIDFCFGGDAFLKHNSDTITFIGHQTYYFKFKFKDIIYHFHRSTENPKYVYRITDGNVTNKLKTEIEDFRSFLSRSYELNEDEISFRELTSQFSRVWGKDNYDVKYPLATYKGESQKKGLLRLIKIFDLYSSFKEDISKLQKKTEENNAIKFGQKSQYLPSIKKDQYNSNIKMISDYKSQLEAIKLSLKKSTINLNEVKNKEILNLKNERDMLEKSKAILKSRQTRLLANISDTRDIKTTQFKKLLEFIPDINEERLQKIESFHKGISTILINEFKSAQEDLQNQISPVENQIREIDIKVDSLIKNDNASIVYFNQIVDLTGKIKDLENQNFYYQEEKNVLKDKRELTKKVDASKKNALNILADKLNTKVKELVLTLYGKQRLSPEFEITKGGYNFKIKADTGTGKAYSNLLVFDLAILHLSKLPMLIHDSFLFKNIENEFIENLLEEYNSFPNQIFISIDELPKFKDKTQKLITSKKRIYLDMNNLLFGKDWGNQK